jgi:hypothetical protein
MTLFLLFTFLLDKTPPAATLCVLDSQAAAEWRLVRASAIPPSLRISLPRENQDTPWSESVPFLDLPIPGGHECRPSIIASSYILFDFRLPLVVWLPILHLLKW